MGSCLPLQPPNPHPMACVQILKGVPEIVIGSILRSAFGSGMLPMPNVQPPYAVTRADLNIADGAPFASAAFKAVVEA